MSVQQEREELQIRHTSGADSFAASLLRGALRAGVDSCVYLPDSCLTAVIRAFQDSGKIAMIPCAREDEGVAIAVGLELGGRTALCLMEASGIGLSALILARAQVQRTPVIVIASHTGGAGEPYDYHGATVLLARGMFAGLGIPYEIVTEALSAEELIYRVVQTARGQRTSFGLLVPPFVAGAAA
jgi:sulfopyruvate decarboxylase TPP-binding subunit